MMCTESKMRRMLVVVGSLKDEIRRDLKTLAKVRRYRNVWKLELTWPYSK